MESEQTELEISSAREKYRIVAARGSIMYFVVATLADIDPMYQYSLKYFSQLFNACIEQSTKSTDLQVRLKTLLKNTTTTVYTNIARYITSNGYNNSAYCAFHYAGGCLRSINSCSLSCSVLK